MKPTIIDFNITNFCNAKCPTCKRFSPNDYLQVDHNLKVFHMDYDEYKKILNANKKYFRNTNCFFCGEFGDPLMHPKIKEFVQTANNYFLSVVVYSNGALNRPDLIEYLTQTKNNVMIRFGIDGLTHEVNNKYRINAKTDIAYKNMLTLAKFNKAKWDYTLFEHNFHELEDVIKFALDNNIKLMLRCNLRDDFFGVNRISSKDHKFYLSMQEKYNKYIVQDKLEFDTSWFENEKS